MFCNNCGNKEQNHEAKNKKEQRKNDLTNTAVFKRQQLYDSRTRDGCEKRAAGTSVIISFN